MSGEGLTLFNSWETRFKNPFGAVKTDQEVVFSIHLPKTLSQERVFLKIFPIDDEKNSQAVPMDLVFTDIVSNHYRCSFVSATPQLLGYYFTVETGDDSLTLKRGKTVEGVLGKGDFWQLTVYSKSMETPKAFGKGIIYQIFPDRFYNSGQPKDNVPQDRHLRSDWGELPVWQPNHNGEVLNNDYFQGDLKGIEEKLDYLVDLGVSLIYLNPVFEAHTSHRYDTGDYLKIDPLLGTEEDFKHLCAAAKEKGIHIILDGVFNHTGSDSVYFNRSGRYGNGGAFNDPSSPYFPWYRFNNYPTEYDSWWGFPTLPNVNEDDESYVEFICGEGGVVEKWLRLGASGYRLDVADELPDRFLDLLYQRVNKVHPSALVTGEVWEDASNKISYGLRRRYLLGGQLDSVMNYPYKTAILSYIREGNGADFYKTLLWVLDNYPPPVIACLMNSISTHDTPRAITSLVGEPLNQNSREWQNQNHYLPVNLYEKGKKLLTLAMVLQFGLPGIPCVYYGDEAGLSGYRDPFNRVCYPWEHQDTQLLEAVTALGQMRKAHPSLAGSPFVPLVFQDSSCTFLRENEKEIFFFGINRCDHPLPLGYHIPKEAQCLFSSEGSSIDTLAPFGSVVFHWSK